MRKQIWAAAAAWVCVLIWGSTFIATKVLLHDFGPVSILFIRTVIGAAALCILVRGRMPKVTWKDHVLLAAAALTGVCLYFVLENIALMHTTASNVSVIVSTSPLATGLLAWWILRDRAPRWTYFAGFAAAMAGIWLVSGADESVGPNITGDLLALGAAGCWAAYSILIRTIERARIPVAVVTRTTFLYGLIFLTAALWLSGETIAAQALTPLPNILYLLFLGLGASAFCFFAWNYAVQQLGPVRTTVFLYAVPLITVVLAVLTLNEQVTASGVCGIALTIAGMVMAQHNGPQAQKPR